MKSWVILTIVYGLCIGFFQTSKKKSVEKNTIYEVLAIMSLIAFLISTIINRESVIINSKYIFVVFIKSMVVAVAWMLSLVALKNMSVSLYGVINLSRILFTVVLSIIFLGEPLTFNVLVGSIIVILGLFLVNKLSNNKESKETTIKSIIYLLISCGLHSISAIIDKSITAHISGGQLQFWFLLFLTIIYWIVLLIKQEKINNISKNYWLLIGALSLTIGDRFLFIANGIPESKASVMTIIKQISAIEIIILGKFMFKEKNIVKKLLCSLIILFGIALTIF